ncbi:MAG TPA: erythromycin esterase family protein [Longimicrobiaceae bacterium]|nr:erythromycin esterase family protein [Longimicrobiaceae bacterium]
MQTEPEAAPAAADSAALRVVRAEAQPLTGGARDHDPLLAAIGDASFVLLGESTHGTHEFYDLVGPRLERAVGVIYLPRTERASHYFLAKMSEQFDAVIHRDTTRAITPLRR